MNQDNQNMTLHLIGGHLDFVRPYVEAELPEMEITDTPGAGYTAVLCDADETDEMYAKYPDAAVIGCQCVIGTGMTGLPRELAARVWRGTFFHVEGSEIPLSSIHATDVARAVRLTLGRPGAYVVTDGRAHTLDEIADALAWRMGQKRVLTAKRRWARWLPGNSLRERCKKIAAADGSDFAARFDFHPADVADYLRTHVYDETSL